MRKKERKKVNRDAEKGLGESKVDTQQRNKNVFLGGGGGNG